MFLLLSKDKTIHEIQQSFSGKYPFLKIEFYKHDGRNPAPPVKTHVSHAATLKAAGLKNDGLVEIKNDLTVGELEKTFLDQFGLRAQVSRKSGLLWLETTMTDQWSLQKQNDHGREITHAALMPKTTARDNDFL